MNDHIPVFPLARLHGRYPLTTRIVGRLLLSLVLLVASSLLIFGGIEALPGDFATTYLGQAATPQAVANIRAELGLDAPAYARYLDWVAGLLHGDFGHSWASGQDIGAQLGSRLSNSLLLAGAAAIIAVPLSIGLGLIAVLYRDRLIDRLINLFSLAAVSLPEFFVAYLLILWLVVKNPVAAFPATVYASMGLGAKLVTIALPVATLVLVVIAHMMRMTRAAIINVMDSAYMETAALKGLGRWRAILRHATPNALAPIINVVALNLAYLIVGVVVVEVVFVYPGMGQYMVDAVTVRDLPVVQACGLVFAAIYILLNMTADILSVLANPRLRHPR